MVKLFNKLFRRNTEEVLLIRLVENIDDDKVVNKILEFL